MHNVQNSSPPTLTTAYLPEIWFFVQCTHFPTVFLETHEHYQKRSSRNRSIISGPNGPVMLSVPLLKGKNNQMPITQVEIAFHEPWQSQHWHSIQTAYGKSPFFEHYASEVEALIRSNIPTLFELNEKIIRFALREIQIDCQILHTELYSKETHPPLSKALCNQWQSYSQPFSYKQPFHPNLSILDLLFCRGPETSIYLEDTAQMMFNPDV